MSETTGLILLLAILAFAVIGGAINGEACEQHDLNVDIYNPMSSQIQGD